MLRMVVESGRLGVRLSPTGLTNLSFAIDNCKMAARSPENAGRAMLTIIFLIVMGLVILFYYLAHLA